MPGITLSGRGYRLSKTDKDPANLELNFKDDKAENKQIPQSE